MVPVEEVKWWLIVNGIGHAVAGCGKGLIVTPCFTELGTIERCTQERPKRICRKCRKTLKTATHHTEE